MTWRTTRSFCGLVLVLICSSVLINASGFAQNPYTVCIGDRCDHPAYINLNCSFAAAHRDITDDEAARLVCMVRNNYEKYTYVRTGATKGGRCGATYVQVRCH
jgi:hypothetical protein